MGVLFLHAALFLSLHIAIAPESLAGSDKPKVVSISPSLTELVCSLGLADQLAGRSSSCDVPESVRTVPIVGGFGRPNLEAVISSGATFLLITDLERPEIKKRLEDAGIETVVLPCESWDELMRAALKLSEILATPGIGEKWVGEMESRKEALVSRVNAFFRNRQRPRVYVEIWHDPIMSAGAKSFMTELIELSGGEAIGRELDAAYTRVSAEWVVRKNPDVILIAYMEGENAMSVDRLSRRPGWANVRAIRDEMICASIPPDWLLRPGPRWLDGANALADYLMAVSGER